MFIQKPLRSRILTNLGYTSARTVSTSCGLVGYPNVGKSTLFNALSQTQAAQASNYPFCTIEPNIAKVAVYDENIFKLQKACQPQKTTPAQIQVWDIAGLIKGASKGAGLGNKFLSNIRSVTAIIHVLRCFEDERIVHVDDVTQLDPVAQLEAVRTELLLADLEVCERKRKRVSIFFIQRGLAKAEERLWGEIFDALNNGMEARRIKLSPQDQKILKSLPLITAKPCLYVCNVDHDSALEGNYLSSQIRDHLAQQQQDPPIILSALLQHEAAVMKAEGNSQEEQSRIYADFLEAYGLSSSGVSKLLEACSNKLNLQLFYTAGPTQVSSWFIKKGQLAPQAAGKIHSDFQKGFICAEVCKVEDYEEYKTESRLRAAKKLIKKGKDYEMQEKDVVLFKAASSLN